MNDALDPAALARQPTQQRAKDRFDRILKEAEKLLIEQGLSGFSIPDLAQRLGYTRGSVYAYFPTPYAILNELVHQYLIELEGYFHGRLDELRRLPWREGVAAVVDHAVTFHNSNPAARLLILGGAVTDSSYRAQEQTNKRLGALGGMAWSIKMQLPKNAPDMLTLAADIGTACFRRSVFEHGTITKAYRDAAVDAMTGFLSTYVKSSNQPAEGKARSGKSKR